MPCDSVCQTIEDFYPRPPRGGRRCQPRPGSRPDQFLSTPSARRATATPGGDYSGVHISIHALREEGDLAYSAAWSALQISIHALREEGDSAMFVDTSIQLYFYPRPPRGGRPHIVGLPSKNRVISIHALREEGDYGRFSQLVKVIKFLSTPSARRATTARPASRSCAKNFYPRPPRGGRPRTCATWI